MNKRLILVIGPESTGTRVFTQVFSGHADILGTPNASTHVDLLDDVWFQLEKKELDSAIDLFPSFKNYKYIITRRSMPHAEKPGLPAKTMNFSDLEEFRFLTKKLNIELILFITTRSFIPNLISWQSNRSSAKGSLNIAYQQYLAAYKHLFDFITKYDVPFCVLNFEALIYEKEKYVNSIFSFLNLSPIKKIQLKISKSANKYRYKSALKKSSEINVLIDKSISENDN